MDSDFAHMMAASKVLMLKPDKAQRRLKVKARSTLMMGIPYEHRLKFNSIKDAKQLMEAIEKRFDGNAATKKTQRNLLKQQYENFIASNLEMVDQTFDRLQKLVYEPKVKGMSSSNSSTQNMAFGSSSNNSSTNRAVNTTQAVNTAIGVSTSGTQVNIANIDNLSDTIHPDDLEEMDLRWQMAMLTIRAKRFLKKTGRKLTVNGNDTIGFDKSNVECNNCHKRGHFARECRAIRSQDNKHKESTRRTVPVETPASTDLISCDSLGGYDWSDQAEEGANYALVAYICTRLDEFSNKPVVENCYAKASETKPKDKTVKPSIPKIEFVKPKQPEKKARKTVKQGNPQMDLQEKEVINSGCSRHMTGIRSYLTDYEEIDGGYVAFGDHKVKVIRCDNRTEFKNREINQFCEMKGILSQYSVARTPQQNRVAERRNRTLIEAARTMLADLKLPTIFWAEAVNAACYVQNRVLVVKPHNKTLYELFHDRTPALSFMKPFGCPVTILNTLDYLGKFNSKADEGFFVRYSLSSKAFRVFNSRKRIVKENLHIRFSENTPNIVGSGPDWLFDIDALTRTMNYEIIVVGTQSNGFAGTKACDNAGQARKEKEPVKDYILLPLWTADPPFSQDPKSSQDDGFQPLSDSRKKVDEDPSK
nr:ribonuclease H-like domain-containing protein [Tanacetum cinerariifolium]